MNEEVRRALYQDRTVDITTIGRRTGLARRIEIWFHNVDGRLFITGIPGRRDWYGNLLSHPEFIFHLKGSVGADLPARAVAILREDERRAILSKILSTLGGNRRLEAWVKGSPLVEVMLEGQ